MKWSSRCNFYPRPPRGGRHRPGHTRRTAGRFLSTPSARRATRNAALRDHPCHISIHALREEGDVLEEILSRAPDDFYPRPPRGGRPSTLLYLSAPALFLSTPSARRATATGDYLTLKAEISIHALREEGDYGRGASQPGTELFLSTPSARRATCRPLLP